MTPFLLLFATLFASLPSGWKPVKDLKGVCQAGVPADFVLFPGSTNIYKNKEDSVEVAVMSSPSPVKPLMEAVAKALNIDKLIDNTPQRVFYVQKPTTGMGKTLTGWTVKVPRGTGNCFATITVNPGGHDDLVKQIAATLAPL